MGRLIGTTTQYSFLPGTTFTNSYTYDAASNRVSFTAPDGSTAAYNYDTLNRLNTLNSSLTGQFTFSYDALSRRTSLTRPNGVSTSYNYDALSRLLSVLHQAGGTTIDGDLYTLDAAGNRTAKQNLLSGITENYAYDLIYQLTQAAQSGNTTESYSYDAVGNRLSSLTVPSLTYNSSNELLSTSRASYTYDYNGNLISKTNSSGATAYAWDYENRLTSVTLPGSGGTVTFKYDPFGRRIQKNSSAGTTSYLYDGANVVTDIDANGAVLARYTQGAGVDEPLASLTAAGTAFFEADGLGSITSLSGPSGLTDTYTYKPFGITTATGTNPNRFRYTGREWDQETGLYYYRARYYDPQIGRFLSEDPARNGPNLYGYVRNNPGSRMDPSGLWDTDTHSKLIWNALKPCGVDNNTIYQLQEASRVFDDETGLDPSQAFKHAMKAPGQSDEDAINARNRFVATQLRLAWATFDDGEGWLWQEPFAQAIHTLTDMTSPLHMQNGHPITWPSGNAVKHGGIFSKAESWETMMKVPGLMEYNLTLIRDAWQSMTGKKCGCDQ